MTVTPTIAGPNASGPALEAVKLDITGMTCASCALRIEKRLNKFDGVEATVNYATEQASVHFAPSTVSTDDLLAAVKAIGYSAAVVAPQTQPVAFDAPAAEADGPGDLPADRHLTELRQRLIISAALATPVLLMSMIPALQFDDWQWLALTLASPVVVWGGWPFHVAAWRNARHAATTMDTLSPLARSPPTHGRSTPCSSATPA